MATNSILSPRAKETAGTRTSAMRLPHLPRFAWSLIGGAIGLFDFGALIVLDANMTVGEQDATVLIGVLFFLPYAALGWAVGGLAHARERAERDRETITSQLRELERAQRALVEKEKLAGIGRLAAGVAHEVRNPLGVIRASASMAQESFDRDTDPHRALGFICEETDRLDRLIASLLTFAKPQPIDCVETDLTKIFDKASELARAEANSADVVLEVDVPAGLAKVFADPDRLAQTLFSLTFNAIQAIQEADPPPAERRVRLSAHEEGGFVRLAVEDSGPGVSAEFADSMFEPFVTTKTTGTGLGLPMALRMIEAQGGTLRLEPRRAGSGLPGACFTIDFPAATEVRQ